MTFSAATKSNRGDNPKARPACPRFIRKTKAFVRRAGCPVRVFPNGGLRANPLHNRGTAARDTYTNLYFTMKNKTVFACLLAFAASILTGTAQTDTTTPSPKPRLEQYPTPPAGETGKEAPLVYTESMPQFPGGEAALLEYLAMNIKYPARARKKGIQGRVFLSFVVEKDGSLSDLKIVKEIGGGCGEEAMRVARQMPPWKPGMQGEKSVRVRMNLPILFKLDK